MDSIYLHMYDAISFFLLFPLFHFQDFLLPKSLKDSEDNVIQVKVEQASRRYLDHLGYSQTDPPTKLLHNVLKASQRIHQGTPEQGMNGA